jgi:hypothetical protein
MRMQMKLLGNRTAKMWSEPASSPYLTAADMSCSVMFQRHTPHREFGKVKQRELALLHTSSVVLFDNRFRCNLQQSKEAQPRKYDNVRHFQFLGTLLSPIEWQYLLVLYPQMVTQLPASFDVLLSHPVMLAHPCDVGAPAAVAVATHAIVSQTLYAATIDSGAGINCKQYSGSNAVPAKSPLMRDEDMLRLFHRSTPPISDLMRRHYEDREKVVDASCSQTAQVSTPRTRRTSQQSSLSNKAWLTAKDVHGWWLPPSIPHGEKTQMTEEQFLAINHHNLPDEAVQLVRQVVMVPLAKLTTIRGLWVDCKSLLMQELHADCAVDTSLLVKHKRAE